MDAGLSSWGRLRRSSRALLDAPGNERAPALEPCLGFRDARVQVAKANGSFVPRSEVEAPENRGELGVDRGFREERLIELRALGGEPGSKGLDG